MKNTAQRDNDAISVTEQRHTLTEEEAARFLGLRSGQTLYLRRRSGEGPPFVRYRGRLIRYRLRDLADWQQRQLVRPAGISR